MIYLIDDKKSRQKDFGWDDIRFNELSSVITPIWSVEDLNEKKETIVKDGNIVLFHDSFYLLGDSERHRTIDSFKSSLLANSDNLYIAYFSGSKCGRFTEERMCMLPPDVLYSNLDVFIEKVNEGNIDFRFLAFGENFLIEEILRLRLKTINENNVGGERITIAKKVFFAATSDDAVEPPFNNVQVLLDWDWFDSDVTDLDLDKLVKDWFEKTNYDVIYIPLCFGDTMSDFMGLRLAMHIRLTSSLNQETPIYVYGVATYEELILNDCFDILKAPTVRLISCDNASFVSSYNSEMPICDLQKEIKLIHLDLPSNIGRHTLANQWGADVLAKVAGVDYSPKEQILDARKSLYFKYARIASGGDSYVSKKVEKIDALGKKILLIDDEADKGWSICLKSIFLNCPEEYFDVVDIDISDYKDLPEGIKTKIEKDYYDLYLLDLRLLGNTEEDNVMTRQFSGYRLLNSILKKNKGNQVMFLTASNKAWNIKNLLSEGAKGYYIKETPELILPLEFSIENYSSFIQDAKKAFDNDYKRLLFRKIQYLSSNIKKSKKLRQKEITNDLNGILMKQFIPFMIKICSKEDFVASYLILFSVFEIIKNFYRTDVKMGEKEPIAAIVSSVYEQIGRGGNIWAEVEELVEARNNYIHPKKDKKTAEFIYNKEGLLKLFNVILKIINSLM